MNLVIPIVGLSLALLCGSAAAQEADGDAPLDPEKARVERRQRLEEENRLIPSEEAHAVRDVIEFALEDDHLYVKTGLTQTDGKAKLEITDLPGFATVNVQGKSEANKSVTPRYFELQHFSFFTPGAIQVQTTVFSSIGYLQIARTTEGIEQDHIVQYIQMQRPFGPDMNSDDGVTLYVQVMGKNDEETLNLKLSAANIVELRRKFPQETSIHLQPIFRDLGQDATVFAVDPRLAWQVFARAVRPEADVVERVRQVVAQFDADDFHKREGAMAELEKLGQPAAIALMQLDRSGLTDEQNSRIDTFLAPYRPVSDAEADKLRASPGFLLDCLISDDEQVRSRAAAALGQTLGRDVEFDINAAPAERSAQVARLRAQLMPGSATQSAGPQNTRH